MMKLALAAAAVALSACASAPEAAAPAKSAAPAAPAAPAAVAQTPAEMLIGSWTCVTAQDGMTVTAKQTYAAGGLDTVNVVVAGAQGGMTFEVVANGEGKWTLADDQFGEMLTRLTVTSAKMNGQPAPPTMNEMFQSMMDELMVNQPLTAKATVTPNVFTQVDPQGVVTKCTR